MEKKKIRKMDRQTRNRGWKEINFKNGLMKSKTIKIGKVKRKTNNGGN